jgi:DNA repair exonuclease SbcCD ATPase subunit
MKKITFILMIACALIMINSISFAQKTVVTETTENLGGTVNPAFSVFIENAEYKAVLNAWKTLFEDHRGKIATSKKDINISNAEFPLLSTTPVAVFSRITSDKLGVKVVAAFNKEGQYVCTKYLPNETEVAKKIIYDFAVSIKREMVQAELDAANKILDKMRDENKDLLNKIEGLNKDIQSYNKKINKTETDILEKTDMTADDKAKKEKEISDYKAKISGAENAIKENDQKLTQLKVKIENQVKTVEDVKTKLDAVD